MKRLSRKKLRVADHVLSETHQQQRFLRFLNNGVNIDVFGQMICLDDLEQYIFGFLVPARGK